MVRRWPGSTCGGTRTTGPTGRRCRGAAVLRRRADGGCDVLEDPERDARDVDPLWDVGTAHLPHVRALRAREAGEGPGFDLWRLPGRKVVVHEGEELTVTAVDGPRTLRFTVAAAVGAGTPYGVVVPVDGRLRVRLPVYQAQLRAIAGEPAETGFRAATRAGMTHFRGLQALDASLAGARQRDIAAAVFGAEAVRTRWSADSELRAQVRHLLSRAEGLMRGGYLALAGVARSGAALPGEADET